MPVLIGTGVHALPSPDATATKCGIPFAPPDARRPGQLVGERTKARVTCAECRRIGSAGFARGWGDAIARGVIDNEQPEEER